jgi:hypothetical protein
MAFGLFNIPFFYFNSEFLLKKIFKQKGLLVYLSGFFQKWPMVRGQEAVVLEEVPH